MSNEFDLRRSIAEVCGSSTRLVNLTGKSSPVVRWGDHGMNDRPIVTYMVTTGRYRRGTADSLEFRAQFDVWVDPNSSQGTEEAIADELESIIVHSNLNSTARTSPVDVAPWLRSRRELPELDEGRRRLTLEYDIWLNR
jgi:hypothetical protein